MAELSERIATPRERAQKIAEQFSSFDGCHRAHLSDTIAKAIDDAIASFLSSTPSEQKEKEDVR